MVTRKSGTIPEIEFDGVSKRSRNAAGAVESVSLP